MKKLALIMLVYEDQTCTVLQPQLREQPPVAQDVVEKGEPKKKRKSPRRRCQLCEKLIDRDRWDSHQERHRGGNPNPVTGTDEDQRPRSWEDIEREAAEALDERIDYEETRALEEPTTEEVV